MSLVDSVPGSSARGRSTSRQVFVVWGCALGALAAWCWTKQWPVLSTVAGLPAMVLLVSALRPPRALANLAARAARFSDQAAELLSRVVLGLWYYVVFTPVALLWRAFRKAPADGGWWRDFESDKAPRFDRPF